MRRIIMKRIMSIVIVAAMLISVFGAVVVHAESAAFRGYLDEGGDIDPTHRSANPVSHCVTSFEIGKGNASLLLSGWAVSLAGIKEYKVYCDDADITSGCEITTWHRQDVINAVASEGYTVENNPTSGLKVIFPTRDLDFGDHLVEVCLIDGNDEEQYLYEVNITVTQGAHVSTDESVLRGKALDNIYYNGQLMCQEGYALSYISDLNENRIIYLPEYDITAITFTGWVGFAGVIDQFGYRLGETDCFGDFKHASSEAVLNAGGENACRFVYVIPVDGVTEDTRVALLVKFTTGEVVEIPDFWFNISVSEPPAEASGDADSDGEITDWDAIVFERYLAGWNVEIDLDVMDLDADGEISDWDAIMLQRFLAGWNVEFG